MTEQEWLVSDDVGKMLTMIEPSERKLRLFAAACVRTMWVWLDHPASRFAIELSERATDGGVSYSDLDSASGSAEEVFEDLLGESQGGERVDAAWMASCASSPDMSKEIGREVARGWPTVALFRDVIGDPFQGVRVEPALRTPVLVSLSIMAYENRQLPSGHLDFDRLAVLADALEEAGCDNADILNHLRGPGPHVRGCWVVDLLLGNT